MRTAISKQIVLIAVIIAGIIGVGVESAWSVENPCDRECLTEVLEKYIQAVIAGTPETAPLATNYRATENAIDVTPGEGFWTTSTAMGNVHHYYGDPVNGSGAFYGVIKEGEASAIVSVRVKIHDLKISEAEWVIARKGESLVNFKGIAADQPVTRSLPENEWSSREGMVAVANAYFNALQSRDPDYVVPSVKGCPRLENGTKVTGRRGPVPEGEEAVEFGHGDCTSGLHRMTQISGVIERIFPVVDQQAGVVLGRGVFNRPPGANRRDGTPWPRNYLMEYFTVDKGKISGIYAIMHYLPPEGNGTSW